MHEIFPNYANVINLHYGEDNTPLSLFLFKKNYYPLHVSNVLNALI